MKLTAVVPFYNVEAYLHDCLASIAGQTMRDFEVILVDDGSPDGSREIAEAFAAEDKRFRVVEQQNQGLGPARNTGMRDAAGDYITFIDSDDIIPREAWARMVRRLDRSGSDFAAGDARRFNIHGVRESWVHRVPFAADHTRTHISRFPELAHDRMVWNKVYRRSFWEEHGFRFPAMLYEDYPVTFRAHVEARSVEVVSQPIYLWRERDGGEKSITQRVFEVGNIADRVTSALMVLELCNDRARVGPDVRRNVHQHFLRTDVGAVARAIALSAGTEAEGVQVAAGQKLVGALDSAVIDRAGRYQRLQADLIRLGAAEELSYLFEVLDEVAPPLASRRHGPLRTMWSNQDGPAAERFNALPASVRRVTESGVGLTGKVEDARWHDDVLHLRVSAKIGFAGTPTKPRLRATLVPRREGDKLPVTVAGDLEVHGDSVLATLTVPARDLLAPARENGWVVHLDLDTGSVHRSGKVTGIAPGTATLAEGWVAPDGRWVVPGRHLREYAIRVLAPTAQVDGLAPGFGPEFRLSGHCAEPLPVADTQLEVGTGERTHLFPVAVDPSDPRRWNAHVQLAALADRRHVDPFVPETTELPVQLLTPARSYDLFIAPGVDTGRFAYGGREVQVVGGRFFRMRIDELDPQFTVESTGVNGTVLSLAGRWLGERAPVEQVVLRWHHDPDRPEEITVDLDKNAEDFRFDLDLSLLTERMAAVLGEDRASLEARTHAGEWLMSFRVDARDVTAHLSPTAVRRLPGPVRTPGGTVELSTHRQLAARLAVSDLSV
ncbi:MAG: glycosyltransferase family 2 protein [Nocardioidaceae bacterium]|nr:glycosyltransferase family 2 protein [Nocardioidaceae bacterium]